MQPSDYEDGPSPVRRHTDSLPTPRLGGAPSGRRSSLGKGVVNLGKGKEVELNTLTRSRSSDSHSDVLSSLPGSLAAPHSLTFRVMRLARPLPSRRPNLLQVAPGASGKNKASSVLGPLPRWEGEGAICGVGAAIVLPQTFGSIFTGETFRAFVCLYNRTQDEVTQVTTHMELHHNDAIVYQAPNRSSVTTFAGQANLESVFECPLKDSGVHVLVCLAEYKMSKGEKRTLKQYFRFNVTNPVKFSFTVTRRDGQAQLVDLKLINATQAPLSFSDVRLEPGPGYSVRSLQGEAESSVLQGYRVGLGPGDARNYLFLATPRRDQPESKQKLIGTPSVRWRGSGGQEGALNRIGEVLEPSNELSDLEVIIDAVPGAIFVHQPFLARCRVRNNSSSPRRLYLQVRRDLVGEVVPVGVSGKSLGEVAPQSTVHASLEFLPFTPGRHRIAGVRVVDVNSRVTYNSEPPEGPEIHVRVSDGRDAETSNGLSPRTS